MLFTLARQFVGLLHTVPTKLKRKPRPENSVLSLHYCWARFEISTQVRVTDEEQRTISSLSFLSNHIAGNRLSRGHVETQTTDCRLCRHCRLSWLCRLQSAGCADFAPLDCSLFRLQTLQTFQTVQTVQTIRRADYAACADHRLYRLSRLQTTKTVDFSDCADCPDWRLWRLQTVLTAKTTQTFAGCADRANCAVFFHKSVTERLLPTSQDTPTKPSLQLQ